MSDPPPPVASGAAAPGRHWGEVIYRELCAVRIWTDHYDMTDGKHRRRGDGPDVDDTQPLPVGVPDTGDVIDPNADDPTPDPVTDSRHPDWVEPYLPPES